MKKIKNKISRKYLKTKRYEGQVETRGLKALLETLNHLAPIGLFLLAIFGYFYTVQPFYTKALLEEQIAEKEIKLDSLSEHLKSLQQEMADQKDNLNLTNQILADKEKELAKILHAFDENYDKAKKIAVISIKSELTRKCSIPIFNAIANSQTHIGPSKKDIEDSAECLLKEGKTSEYFLALNDSDRKIIWTKLKDASQYLMKNEMPILDDFLSKYNANKESFSDLGTKYAVLEAKAENRIERLNIVNQRSEEDRTLRQDKNIILSNFAMSSLKMFNHQIDQISF